MCIDHHRGSCPHREQFSPSRSSTHSTICTESKGNDDILWVSPALDPESSTDAHLDGVHVIHQLAQAGRTLVAVILNCRNADFRPLISPCIEGLRSCVGLLRRFSGRYLCGLRSADIIDEFCRSESERRGWRSRSFADESHSCSLQHPRRPAASARWNWPIATRLAPTCSKEDFSFSVP